MKELLTKDLHAYRKGRLLLMQRGEYSDQSTVGLFRVLRDFDAQGCVARYLELHPPKELGDKWVDDDGAGFVHMLVSDGCLEELEYDVLHTGSYGELSLPPAQSSNG